MIPPTASQPVPILLIAFDISLPVTIKEFVITKAEMMAKNASPAFGIVLIT